MPLSAIVLSEAEGAAGLEALEPGLLFVLDQAGVPSEVQQLLGHSGFRSLALFSRIGASEAEVRSFLVDDLKIDVAGGGVPAKLALASVAVAWDAGRRRLEKRLDEEAVQRASDGAARPIPKSSFLETRRAYEAFRRKLDSNFTLDDKFMPSKGYIELLMERTEDGDLRPETLSEVLSADKDTDDPWSIVRAGSDGVMRIHKSRATGSPPTDPESLRRRYRLMAAAWQCVAFRLPNSPFLQGYQESLFTTTLLEHLLGDHIYGYACESVEGHRHSCSWQQLLAFEFQLRRKMFKIMEEGSTFPAAVAAAIADEPTRRQHFETPMAMSAGAAMASRGRPSFPSASSQGKGQGRGKGRGGNKGGSNKGGGQVKKDVTGKKGEASASAQQVCYRFQKGKCKFDNCVFKHVCTICGSADHGSHKCGKN